MSGLCIGCARTTDEIAVWRTASVDQQRHVWAKLPERRKTLGLDAHRLPWSAEVSARFIERTLQQRAGTWVFGVYGAVGRFMIDPCEDAEIVSNAHEITAVTARGALRLRKHEKTIAFAIGRHDGDVEPRAIGLVLPRARALIEPRSTLHALGPDKESISFHHRDAFLYDLGLGHRVARFCIRTELAEFKDALDTAAGSPWTTAIQHLGHEMFRTSPHRVIESALGRIEVYAPIPNPADASPTGPHTQVLPNYLAMNRETPPDWDLPHIFAPCAIFYPHAATSFAELQPEHV